MGAISGIYVFGGDRKAVSAGPALFGQLKIYSFQGTGEWTDGSVHLGCGVFHHTPESKLEELPGENETGSLVLAADAIIDNRTELLEQLGLDETQVVTDGTLILKAYEKWGHACPNHLIGDYAFAVWDKERRELFLARDAMGSRTLYYTQGADYFAFCTVEKPLVALRGEEAELNEKWIADFLSIEGIQHETDPEETVYRDIYQLPPAHTAVVRAGEFRKNRYWDPLKDIKPVRFASDEEYEEAFNRIFKEAVACRLRSAGETGIFLSGGMDSGSIACVAAPLLEAQGRKLHGFTSVPVPDFDKKPPRMRVYNEAPEVDLIAEAYPNVEITYSSFAEKNCTTDIDELIRIFEQPYKIFRNMTWYHSFLKLAAERNCTVMLNGQSGNNTISYGNFAVHLMTLWKRGRAFSAVRELLGFSRLVNEPISKVFKSAIPVVTPYRLKLWRSRRELRGYDRFRGVPVNRSLARKWKVESRLDAIGTNVPVQRYPDYREDLKSRTSPLPLVHIGAVETKLSLANGITIRDPSRDRRVFEFCMAIPSGQFVRHGQERYLLRRAMKGILPDPIRLNIIKKGLQSADWIHRLVPDWPGLLAEARKILDREDSERYLETEQLRELLDEVSRDVAKVDEDRVAYILTAVIFARFVDSYKRERISRHTKHYIPS
ncbi:Asparagine synthetase [glutamine-hydrolyzing] 3 [compost metagenome]